MLALISLGFASCEKDIDIDVPAGQEQLVIEGSIENGGPPIVLVSRTRGFFDPTSAAAIAASYISDADVRVNDIPLTPICSSAIPPEFQQQFSELVGIAIDDLGDIDICAYIGLQPELLGMENTTYQLRVETDGRILTASSHLPRVIAPDSTWFRLWADSPQYGYVFCNITDPDTLENAYRIFTRRIGPNVNDNPVDPVYYAPLGSTFLDEFFNGQTFELGFTRGQEPNSSLATDTGDEAGYFEIGDRFVFKFCSTTRPVYQFFRTMEAQQGTNGSPFASPSNVISNINGGLGVWAAYACHYDTLLATP